MRPDLRDFPRLDSGATPRSASSAVEDYLKAVYALETRLEGPVPTNALAERLASRRARCPGCCAGSTSWACSSTSATAACASTARGAASRCARCATIGCWSCCSSRCSTCPWDLVHEEAELLEHVLSDELAERIAAKLGNPEFDPHGDPIPSADLDLTERETRALEEVDVGETVAFVRVSDADPAMLRHLAERGIVPGVTLTLIERQPFGGPLSVKVAGEAHHLGGQLAAAMRVA